MMNFQYVIIITIIFNPCSLTMMITKGASYIKCFCHSCHGDEFRFCLQLFLGGHFPAKRSKWPVKIM